MHIYKHITLNLIQSIFLYKLANICFIYFLLMGYFIILLEFALCYYGTPIAFVLFMNCNKRKEWLPLRFSEDNFQKIQNTLRASLKLKVVKDVIIVLCTSALYLRMHFTYVCIILRMQNTYVTRVD